MYKYVTPLLSKANAILLQHILVLTWLDFDEPVSPYFRLSNTHFAKSGLVYKSSTQSSHTQHGYTGDTTT